MIRQEILGVCFYLEVGGQRQSLMNTKRFFYGEPCCPELSQFLKEHRHVKMDAPFTRTRVAFPRVKGFLEIQVLADLAVLALGRLRKIDGFSELLWWLYRVLRGFCLPAFRPLLQVVDRPILLSE